MVDTTAVFLRVLLPEVEVLVLPNGLFGRFCPFVCLSFPQTGESYWGLRYSLEWSEAARRYSAWFRRVLGGFMELFEEGSQLFSGTDSFSLFLVAAPLEMVCKNPKRVPFFPNN